MRVRHGESFPHPPLQLVAFELRWAADAVAKYPRQVIDGLLGVVPNSFVELAPPVEGRAEPALFRLVSDRETLGVSLWRTSLVVECSEYGGFASFRQLLV